MSDGRMGGGRTDGAGTAGADHPVEVLRRWQDSGAIWRVVRRTETGLEIDLLTCTGDEVMGHVTSSDPSLLAFVGDRAGSDD